MAGEWGPLEGLIGDWESDKGGLDAAFNDNKIDGTNGKLYINTGTQSAPTWTVAGAHNDLLMVGFLAAGNITHP